MKFIIRLYILYCKNVTYKTSITIMTKAWRSLLSQKGFENRFKVFAVGFSNKGNLQMQFCYRILELIFFVIRGNTGNWFYCCALAVNETVLLSAFATDSDVDVQLWSNDGSGSDDRMGVIRATLNGRSREQNVYDACLIQARKEKSREILMNLTILYRPDETLEDDRQPICRLDAEFVRIFSSPNS